MSFIVILRFRAALADQRHVGDEGQAAGALDGSRHLPLVLGAVAADPAGDDLAPLGDEVLQRCLVLEVGAALFGAEPPPLLAAKAPPPPPPFLVAHPRAAAEPPPPPATATKAATAAAAATTGPAAKAAAAARILLRSVHLS